MYVFPRKLSLTMAALLLVVLLTAVVTFRINDFFSHSAPASANNGVPETTMASSAATTAPDKTIQPHLVEAYGKLPMSFEANQGQTDAQVKFLARGSGYSLFLTSSEAVLSLNKPVAQKSGTRSSAAHRLDQAGDAGQAGAQRDVLRIKLVGANSTPHVVGLEELPGQSNYLIGNEPKQWRTNVAHYARVKYEAVYSGVDMVYYGNQRQLEYDFIVAPGANPSAIRLAFEGAQGVRIDAGGHLVLHTGGGEVRQHKPFIYQETGGERREVAGQYVKKGKHQVGFEVGEYDATRPLVIDPVLVYSTYLGGSIGDIGFGITVDSAGNAYVAGYTGSADFPTTAGAFQTAHAGGGNEAFITKLNPSGSSLVYSTYLGGGDSDEGYGIASDGAGNVYVTGATVSANFPTTPGAFDTSYNGGSDAFVTKLDASGASLVYSTFLGGSGNDNGRSIAIDGTGNAYVAGNAGSTNFPTTPGVFQPARGVGSSDTDAFVTKLNSSGASLLYSTYLGGGGTEIGFGIAVDAAGSAHVAGYTDSPNFPTTPLAFDTSHNGGLDAFVTKFDALGSSLLYSTYLGGGATEIGNGIALDEAGQAYVTGYTISTNFPTTPGAFDTSFNITTNFFSDVFVTKLNTSGSSLAYSTFLGGSGGDDIGNAVSVNAAGDAYVTGFTDSPNFPTTPLAFDTSHNGGLDGFVTRLSASGSSLFYSTFLGGSGRDGGRGIAADMTGNAYITGETVSSNFPTTVGAFDTSYNNHFDAFVTKLRFCHHTLGNFDNDPKTDLAVWRPSEGLWRVVNSADGSITSRNWGTEGDKLVPGDYDADGKTDFAVFRPSEANWYIINSSTGATVIYHWGESADRPVPADYDGDGKADVAVFRPSENNWYVLRSSGGSSVQSFGEATDTLVQGDYDGDGKADLAVWRPSENNWYILHSSDNSIRLLHWGLSGDKPVPADYDGDCRLDIAVYRPSEFNFYIIGSASNNVSVKSWGESGDILVPADYDADGKADIATFRPSGGEWWIIKSSTNTVMDNGTPGVPPANGTVGDIPVPSVYIESPNIP